MNEKKGLSIEEVRQELKYARVDDSPTLIKFDNDDTYDVHLDGLARSADTICVKFNSKKDQVNPIPLDGFTLLVAGPRYQLALRAYRLLEAFATRQDTGRYYWQFVAFFELESFEPAEAA